MIDRKMDPLPSSVSPSPMTTNKTLSTLERESFPKMRMMDCRLNDYQRKVATDVSHMCDTSVCPSPLRGSKKQIEENSVAFQRAFLSSFILFTSHVISEHTCVSVSLFTHIIV